MMTTTFSGLLPLAAAPTSWPATRDEARHFADRMMAEEKRLRGEQAAAWRKQVEELDRLTAQTARGKTPPRASALRSPINSRSIYGARNQPRAALPAERSGEFCRDGCMYAGSSRAECESACHAVELTGTPADMRMTAARAIYARRNRAQAQAAGRAR